MKYFTKEWYELSQKTGLHFGMKVNKKVEVFDEDLYLKLYKIKGNKFVKIQREIYELDSRYMFFEENKYREEFILLQENIVKDKLENLPAEIINQIADFRVFSLGYCTRKVYNQLKKISIKNEKEIENVINEYSKVNQSQPIPSRISDRFFFHDCKVTELIIGKNITMKFDITGEIAEFDMLKFTSAEIIKNEDGIVGSIWLYEELYFTKNGYEAHMLFWTKDGLKDFIVYCDDIFIKKN